MTIWDLNLQIAYDVARASLMSMDDYDALPPAKLDDEMLGDEEDDPLLDVHGDRRIGETSPTGISIALALAKPLPLGLSILKLSNDIRTRDDSYNETLRLNSEFVQACRSL